MKVLWYQNVEAPQGENQAVKVYRVYTRVEDPTPDPAATMAKVAEAVAANPLTDQIKAIALKVRAQREKANKALADGKAAEQSGNNAALKKAEAEYNAAMAQIPVFEQELAPLLAQAESLREQLFNENIVPCIPGPDAELIEDAEAAVIAGQLAALGEHEKLTGEGVVPDRRGVEFWAKEDGVWVKRKIERFAVPLPEGAVLTDDLNKDIPADTPPSQKAEINTVRAAIKARTAEIAAEQEADRILSLTPEQRAQERDGRIASVKREAALKKQEADLFGDIFDITPYQQQIAGIEQKYA